MLVEMLSQSYRCVLPITPWIYFLTDDDEASHLSFAKALLVAYVCFKVTAALTVVLELLGFESVCSVKMCIVAHPKQVFVGPCRRECISLSIDSGLVPISVDRDRF